MLLTTIFYHVDNFCKKFEEILDKHSLPALKRKRARSLCKSEVMTIVIYFHHSGFKTFKDYYNCYVKNFLRQAFGNRLVSYNRFIELMQECNIHLYVFMNFYCVGKCTGISFIDSTHLKVCHNRRIYSHKTFKGSAMMGVTSLGWFYGFKLHLSINEKGGKIFGDRGYISSKLFKELYNKGIRMFSKIRKNMKNKLLPIYDKLLLQKRGIIESVINLLKNSCTIDHTRHRSKTNFFVNLVSGLIAYSFLEKKPSISFPAAHLLQEA